MLFGTYEQALVHSIKKLVRPGEICIDVGAERGYITLHLARAVSSGGRVLAFEPDPRAAEILSLIVKRNQIDSIVKIFQCALADKERVSPRFFSPVGWDSPASFQMSYKDPL
jgi:FkbM family methyltransferase